MNGIDYLDRGWQLGPDRPCMVDADTSQQRTYDEVRQTTFLVANALRGRGIGPGSRVAVLSDNSLRAFEIVLSVFRAEAVHLPVNARNAPAENATIFQRFGCELLFIESEFADLIPLIASTAPSIKAYVCIDGDVPLATSLERFVEGFDATTFVGTDDPERPWEILTTGGTTGFPKGVVWPQRQIESIVANYMAVSDPEVRPTFLAAAPLTHLAGKFMQFVLASGGCGVVYRRVDRRRILGDIARFQITHVFLPPTVIYDLLADPTVTTHDYSSLVHFVYSAAPMAPEKVRQAIEVFGPVMCQVWGQSESAWNTILLPRDHFVDGRLGGDIASAERLASCGRPLPFVKVAVMGPGGELLDAGNTGELVVRGPCVMTGYLGDDAAQREVSAYGWHHTGDVGFRDEEGYFYIVDRLKDMIISGGFNIYSIEVERSLLDHPLVSEAAVFGVADARWGEAVHAVVEVTSNDVTPEELVSWCRGRIGAMKAPKVLEIVDAIPRNTNGKVLKRRLRESRQLGRA